MAIIKVFLEKGETQESVEELLNKAYQFHAAGEEHKNAFHDSSARDVFNKLINAHDKMLDELTKEIIEIINKDT